MLAETVNFIKYLHVAVPVDVDVEVDPVVRLLILTARYTDAAGDGGRRRAT